MLYEILACFQTKSCDIPYSKFFKPGNIFFIYFSAVKYLYLPHNTSQFGPSKREPNFRHNWLEFLEGEGGGGLLPR